MKFARHCHNFSSNGLTRSTERMYASEMGNNPVTMLRKARNMDKHSVNLSKKSSSLPSEPVDSNTTLPVYVTIKPRP